MTLMGTMAELARSGFVEHFGVRGDELQSFDSGRTFAADQVVMAKSGKPFSLRAVSNAARSLRVTRGHQSRRMTSSFPLFN